VQSTVILRTALFCSGGMRGHPAGVRRTDNTQREPSDGEVQPVSRGVPSEMFQHEVDRQHPELQRRLVAESLCHEIGENHPSPVNVAMLLLLFYRLVVTFVVVCPFSLFVLGSVLNIND